MPNRSAEQLLDAAGQHLDARRFTQAESDVSVALMMEPRNVRALCFKAIIAAETGRAQEALRTVERALKLAPQAPGVLNNAAGVLARCGQTYRAIELWRRLTVLAPDSVEPYYNMAVSHAGAGDPDAAEPLFRKVLALRPDHPGAPLNVADVLKNSGRIEEAIAVIRDGLRHHPQDPRLRSVLLYDLHFHPASTPEEIFRECAQWGQSFEASIPAHDHHDNDPSPQRPLRIGYLSPNFRDHSETYFILPLFRATDRASFQTWAYSCNQADDAVTPLLRAHTDSWRDAAALDDGQLAQLIRDDRIDVLVDLTMHMHGARLGALARRPAPVQVAWLAYPSTTGLTRIDYTILDPHLDPSHSPNYTEKPFHLPDCYWCYEVYGPRPDLAPLPADANRFITFGSQNHYGKVTRETLAIWARILQQVDRSRLLLHVGSKHAGIAARQFFTEQGIARDRVTCQTRVSREEYMRTYQGIDIALDPFPYNGATTTCDALWMGVPVVSRAGATAVSRAGLSILSNLGMPELVAQTWDQYITIAITLAGDLPRLRRLRTSLRPQLEQSKVMNAKAFADQMTRAYRAMWSAWCSRGAPP